MKGNKPVFINRIGYVLLTAVFLLVLISQFGLLFSSSRGYFTAVETFEGIKTEGESSINKGNIFVYLYGEYFNGGLKIFVNGEEYCAIEDKKTKVTIDSPSVIEIYSPKDFPDLKAGISYYDKNLACLYENKKAPLKKGFNVICRFAFENG